MEKVFDISKLDCIDDEKLKTINPDMIPDIMLHNIIYHYTSINGIKDILKNKKLWFTNIDYMNDRDEVMAGAEQLKKVGNANWIEGYSNMVQSEAERIGAQDHKVYVCCFSLERDELMMWNYYTKDVHNHGYNLGFRYKDLIISILKQNPELHGCRFSFGKVDYCIGEETYASQMFHKSLENMRAKVQLLAAWMANKEVDLKTEHETEESRLSFAKYYGSTPEFRQSPSLEVLYFMKRPCFSKEAEFRIVIHVPNDVLTRLKAQGKYKCRISNGLLVPYLELEFDITSITGITLSPTINSDLAERSIRDYCNYCDIDMRRFSEGINKSGIPVRF